MQSLSVWQERVESAWVVFVAHLLWLLSFVKLAPRPGYSNCIGEWMTCGYRFDGNGFPKYPLDWLAERFERRFQAEKKALLKQNLLSGTVKWLGNELYLHWLGYTGCKHLELRFSNWVDTDIIITYAIELTREQDPLHSGYYASDTEVMLKDDNCRYWSIKGGRQTIAALICSLEDWHVTCLGNPCDILDRERA